MKFRLRAAGLASLMAVAAALVPGPLPASARSTAHVQPSVAQAAIGSWTVYHHDNAHTGWDSTQPNAINATTGWTSPALTGQIYTEPLVYNGLVYVATLQNNVYALNQSTGAVVWSRNLGAPETSGWQCGNINPTGILGTGVIDIARSRIYVVPFLHQYHSYYLYGLDLATGGIMQTTQILPKGFDWTIQQQRGALAISKDGTHVYIPFGGRAGDCGPYHGWVEGAPTAGGLADEHYKTPTTGSGIWAAGGVVIDNVTGAVFFATGNAIPCSGAPSDAVIRTSATLASPTFFQPSDWLANWCQPDQDLGSASPVLISSSLMFTSGKYGSGFLLNPTSLGGTGGQLYRADVCHGIHSNAVFGSFAYAAPYVYLECNGGGLVALQVNTAAHTFSQCGAICSAPSWMAGGSTTFGAPIVAGGVVWAVDINGSGLYGFKAATGAQVYHSASFGVNHFATPSEAGGQIFVGAGTVVRSFNMQFGCTAVDVTSNPPSGAMVGVAVTVTGSASGCPNPNPLYQFWMLNPGSGTWQMVQDYSTNATFSWNTTGKPTGTYRFSVWARDATSSGAITNSLGSYDAFNAGLFYPLTPGCAAVGVSAAPASPAMVGTAITISGAASGCLNANPLYQFWILNPGSATWQVAQAYSTNANFNWNTTGRPAGTYRFSVWVHDSSNIGVFVNSLGRYDAFNASQLYTLTPGCGAISVSATPASPTMVGTAVAVTGAASGCLNASPLYQFWILNPGSSTWQVAQAYSTTAMFNWNTTGLPAGTYRFSVWVHDSSNSGVYTNSLGSYDAFNAGQFYTLTPGCASVGVSAAPPSPSLVSTPVTISGAAAGCLSGSPYYQFWILNPGSGTWQIAQAYSTNANFNWNTTGLPTGTYRFSVWVKNSNGPGAYSNSLGTYDAFNASQYYTLT